MLKSDLFEAIMTLMFSIERGSSYEKVCVKRFASCVDNSDLTDLNGIMRKVENGNVTLTYPKTENPISHKTYFFNKYFGGISLVNESNVIKSVKAVRLTYVVKNTYTGWSWIHRALNVITSYNDNAG